VVFRSLSRDICVVVGNVVYGVAAGTATIAADQPGNDNYSPAPQVIRTLTVTPAPWTLTYLAGPGGSITGDAVQVVAHGADGATVSAVADEGAEFVGWSDARGDNPRTDLAVGANITVTARFRSTGGVPIEWFGEHGIARETGEDWADLEQRDFLGKGMTLLEEYVAMTDPADLTSRFRVTRFEPGAPTLIDFEPNSPDRVYSLLYSTNLRDWLPVPGQQNIPGGAPLHDDHRAAPVFYRVLVDLPE
jgi:hypothetical protein